MTKGARRRPDPIAELQATSPAAPHRHLVFLFVFAAAVALTLQLFVWPVGYADNGDFTRATGPFSLFAPRLPDAEQFFNYSIPYLVRDTRLVQDIGFRSTETIVVGLTDVLQRALQGGSVVDLRWLGVVHAIALLTAFWFFADALLRRGPSQVATVFLLLLIVTDVSFVAFLNTPYSEASAGIALVAMAAAMIRFGVPPSRWQLWSYTLIAAAFLFAKPQNAIAAPLLVGLVAFVFRRKSGSRAAVITASVLLLATAWLTVSVTPQRLKQWTYHTAVLMPLTPDQRGATLLRDLGVEPAMIRFAGTIPFGDEQRLEVDDYRNFVQQMTMTRIAWWLLRNPAEVGSRCRAVAGASMKSSIGLGMLTVDVAHAPREESGRFRWWSAFRERMAPEGVVGLGLLLLVIAAVPAAVATKAGEVKPLAAATIVLVLIAAAQYATVAILQSTIDASKHLALFKLCVDLALVFGVASIIELVPVLRKR